VFPESSRTQGTDCAAHPRRESPRALRVGGFVAFSGCDFPGELAAVVFCQGCPWRCRYCHNPHLQRRQADGALSWDEIRDKLAGRRDLLDAVVFSGGEPTAQTALRDAVREVRALGFKVGLHTAGPYPSRLERLLPHTDWVGLDVKAPFDGYDSMTAARGSALRALDSVCAVVESGVAYEVRTTVHPDLIGADELLRLARSLARLGVKRYAVQAFRGRGCADPHLLRSPRSAGLTPKRQAQLAELFEVFELRSG
jgi:pyruvate formate lyase activating enzyme